MEHDWVLDTIKLEKKEGFDYLNTIYQYECNRCKEKCDIDSGRLCSRTQLGVWDEKLGSKCNNLLSYLNS